MTSVILSPVTMLVFHEGQKCYKQNLKYAHGGRAEKTEPSECRRGKINSTAEEGKLEAESKMN